MNWLDWLLLAALLASALAGFRVGLIWGAVAFAALLIGWYFAGSVSAAAALAVESYTDSPAVHSALGSLIYVVLLLVMVYAATRVLRVLRPLLSAFTLGIANVIDRLGGLALGFVAGLLLVGAVVLVGARLAYPIDLAGVDAEQAPQHRLQQAEAVRGGLEDFLTSSLVVRGVTRLAVALPGDALGLAPADLGASLRLLHAALDDPPLD